MNFAIRNKGGAIRRSRLAASLSLPLLSSALKCDACRRRITKLLTPIFICASEGTSIRNRGRLFLSGRVV